MREFYSYGPVNCRRHFCVPRRELVESCLKHIVGDPEDGGHYFTIWSPRQSGKTWLMHQVRREIEERYGERFTVATMSMQGVIMHRDDPDAVFFRQLPRIARDAFPVEPPVPETWDDWINWFAVGKGVMDRPLLLFIDEFDCLPPRIIDTLVTLFRDMYLKRDSFLLHGLALIGVRAVLGVDSERGSPFNVQRSLHVPNFSDAEVGELFRQYQEESGQMVEPEVVAAVYDSTRGQPGLVGWFGELLTKTYNPGMDQCIDGDLWTDVYQRACYSEWNNTVLNIIKKVRHGGYQTQVIDLFSRSDIAFAIDAPWCSYLYLNGVIDKEEVVGEQGRMVEICRFSSPFIQRRLYNALTSDLMGERTPILALEPLDELEDVFGGANLDLPSLLERYKGYLRRLATKGLNPWMAQPRRGDLHHTEAVGHFHLYFWLRNAVGRRCVISPEFPTGNGRVDLHLKCGEQSGVIEVKSFVDMAMLRQSVQQAAGYAGKLGLNSITVALFAPVEEESILAKLSGEHDVDGVRVVVSAIGWT
jgi:hypothetical protein